MRLERTGEPVRSPKITSAHRRERVSLLTHNNLVHKFIPMLQAMKIHCAKAAVDKEWKKLETIPAWQVRRKLRGKRKLLWKHKKKNKVHFASLMDICHLKKSGVRTKAPKIQRTSTQRRQLNMTQVHTRYSQTKDRQLRK